MKKLVNIGSGRSEHIPVSQAIKILTDDLIRLKRMAYFAEKFKSLVLDAGIEIAGLFPESSLLSITNYESPQSLTFLTRFSPRSINPKLRMPLRI